MSRYESLNQTFPVHTHYIQVHVHCYEEVDLTNMVRVSVYD